MQTVIFEKFKRAYYSKLQDKSCHHSLIIYMTIITGRQDRQTSKGMHILFVICICVRTLHLCYMRMHLFSANQKHGIFSCILYAENIFSFVVFLRSCNIHDTYVCTCLTMQSHTFYDKLCLTYMLPNCDAPL